MYLYGVLAQVGSIMDRIGFGEEYVSMGTIGIVGVTRFYHRFATGNVFGGLSQGFFLRFFDLFLVF